VITSPYVQPLLDAPPPSQAELGVLVHRWRRSELRRLSDDVEGTPLALMNPGLDGPARTTRTITCAVTALRPGGAPRGGAPGAGVRVVLEGDAWMGGALRVEAGDVVRLRDDAEWRAGESGALWLDAIDLPLVSAISPDGEPARRRRSPCATCLPRVHRWERTEAVLARSGSPAIARFGTPRGDLTPTLRVEANRLSPGRRTPSARSSGSAVIAVLAGAGTSVVGGWEFGWERGDVFVVPPGAPVDHRADLTADLLVVSDAPALRALGRWWLETEPEPQPVEHMLD
jgi:gentisate 1,2-dioxygenase